MQSVIYANELTFERVRQTQPAWETGADDDGRERTVRHVVLQDVVGLEQTNRCIALASHVWRQLIHN